LKAIHATNANIAMRIESMTFARACGMQFNKRSILIDGVQGALDLTA
jgi:hypothetical protein